MDGTIDSTQEPRLRKQQAAALHPGGYPMKFSTCCMILVGIALCLGVTPSHAAGRILRTDNPGFACDLWSWSGDTSLSSDIYSSQDGNAISFSPGIPTSGPLNFCTPSLSLLTIWESPSQQNPGTNVEAFTDPANPASQPVASGTAQGLPTNLYWTATGAFMYEWVDSTTPNTGENPQAALIVWTLPNTTDLEFEFLGLGGAGGWCQTPTSVATFTWLGNLYTANCSNFSGDDLLIDIQGLPDGYIGATDEAFHSGLSADWSVQYATQVINQSPYNVSNNTPFVVSVQVANKDDVPIGVGTVTLTSANPLINLTSPVNAGNGYATFNISAIPTGLYTFTATYNPVAGQTSSSSATFAVRVDPPVPTVAISVAPTTIDLGQSATVTWSSTNSTTCTATGGWNGVQLGSGSVKVTPTAAGSFDYTLLCMDTSTVTGTSTSATKTATLIVITPPAPTVTVTVTPSTITLGKSATLTWSSTFATSCTADSAWSGAQATSGSLAVTPTTAGGFAYSLTCTGFGGAGNGAAALVVSPAQPPPANAPTVTVTIAPGTITVGQSATLTWSSTNATSCTADSAWTGAQATSGTLSVSPSSAGGYAYSLTCTGTGGTGNGAVGLSVTPAPPPQSDIPTVTISISPSTITVGQSAKLTWSSTNATSCTADSAWTGAQATSGTLSVTPSAAGGYAYSLSCSGAAGVGNGAVGLSVVPVATPDPTPAPSKSGGGSISLWEVFGLAGLLGWRVRRSAVTRLRPVN
jgi:hypothetical protein